MEEIHSLQQLGIHVVQEQDVQHAYVRERFLEGILFVNYDGISFPTLQQAQLASFSPKVVTSVLHSAAGQCSSKSRREQRVQQMSRLYLRSLVQKQHSDEHGSGSETETDVEAEIGEDHDARPSTSLPLPESAGEFLSPPTNIRRMMPIELPQPDASSHADITSVRCPICFTDLAIRRRETPDEVLDRHLDRCSRRQERARGENIQLRDGSQLSSEDSSNGYASDQLSDSADPRPKRKRRQRTNLPSDIYKWNDFDDNMFEQRLNELPDDRSMMLENGRQVDEDIYSDLQAHQTQGAAWLWQLYLNKAGGILADEMGLGKTAQICLHFDSIRRKTPAAIFLVVTPATVLRHWEKELHRWAPRFRVLLFHSMNPTFAVVAALGLAGIDGALARIVERRTPAVVIVSYEGMKRYQDVLLSYEWAGAVLDEGQKIRNPNANITMVCKQIPSNHRLIVSGTPIQNSLRELWSLFDFAYPTKLGPIQTFEEQFVEPLRIGGYKSATPLQARIAVQTATTLQAILRPYMLRRKKKDVIAHAPLPPKTEHILFCKLSSAQRQAYQAVLASDDVRKILRRSSNMTFRAISTLRKLCNHPNFVFSNGQMRWSDHSVDREDDNFDNETNIDNWEWTDSGKLVVLRRVLQMWIANGHRMLIFSQTRMLLNVIERLCHHERWRFLRMDGTTSVKTRQSIIDRFNQDDTIPIMLLTTRTGGLGISLTGADRVILIDPDWNPQTDIQARERAWRIGQTKAVTIYRLITRGTIEEKIYQRQIFKTLLSNQVLDNPKQQRLFSRQHLRELFELTEEDDEDVAYDMGLPDQGVKFKTEIASATSQPGNTDDSGQAKEGLVLAALFSGESVAAVFQHDTLEGGDTISGIPVSVLDEQARKRVDEALASLQQQQQQSWQRSVDTERNNTPVFSSAALLRAIRNSSVANSPQTPEVALAKRVVQILRQHGSLTSQQLLGRFHDLNDRDAPMFRDILRKIATLQGKHWCLNELYCNC